MDHDDEHDEDSDYHRNPFEWLYTEFPELTPPLEAFATLAADLGLVPPGAPLSPALHAFVTIVIERCAAHADEADQDQLASQHVLRSLKPVGYEHHARAVTSFNRGNPVYERFMARDPSRPWTVIHLPAPVNSAIPADWSVPLEPEDYRVEQIGDQWVVTFLPLEQEIYRGAGPVTIDRPPQ